ncbi:MAG: ATP-dependent exonuclease SbcCD, C subunit-like protein [Deltaproteobacteria bacterium]|nr:ATP-dependent exonuclease SbcCD, C subunit-like protein [Deltaproteobacteria bacterium]
MEDQLLDFSTRDALAGFRLHTLEVYNWGTFHKEVWRLELNGKNGLLTGDIGSGKSTLVDAVTTLLVPAHRIAYNKAAGADTRERSLRSYVLGHFKSERSDIGHASKSVALRDYNSFSVILGVFKNEGYSQEVTLAQVFWIKESQGQPQRFYLVADKSLTITEHFSNFGPDINQLRKRLRKMSSVWIFDSFPKYAAAFRRRFGIENEQALALFHQTVSMKSVGNLTDFVREHMLEAFDVQPRIDALIHHFDDLSHAHDAIVKAKDQIERLLPLVSDWKGQMSLTEKQNNLREYRDALTPFFSFRKKELLDKRLENLCEEHERLDRKIETLEQKRRELMGDRDDLKRAIAENGGDRLERIRAEIERHRVEKEKRRKKSDRYANLVGSLVLDHADTRDEFDLNAKLIREQRNLLEEEEANIQNQRTDSEVDFRELKGKHEEFVQELESLSRRKSNINAHQIRIRKEICVHLNLDEKAVPFAGELIQVREEDHAWEGAAERLLHNFGLSLLVSEKYYKNVSAWVDGTRLKGRLVYYLVRMGGKESVVDLHPDSLVKKLSVKPDSEFYSWVEKELERRFNYACCTDMRQFHREPQAITTKGQIKSGGNRHEKDDRRDIGDRSYYILGWSNESKIKTLKKRRRELETRMRTLAETLSDLAQRHCDLKQKQTALIQLGEFRNFNDLDWKSVVRDISRLEEEKQRLEETSDILKTLEQQLKSIEEKIVRTEKKLGQEKDTRSKNEEKQKQANAGIKTCDAELAGMEIQENHRRMLFKKLEAIRVKELEKHVLTVESCTNREKEMRKLLQGQIDKTNTQIRNLNERIIKAMNGYRRDYPLETRDVDDSVSSAPEYETMLKQLQEDNLPRFEKRFKELLNENTIREVANFQSQLLRERETIKERIDRINQSLGDIEYNSGRYIVLEAQLNPDMDIRDFQQQLRACTEGALTGSDEEQYSESKFLQVRAVIERFRGREGTSDMDKRWTRKVTDVRNWFVFAASERWEEDDSEYEHYTDSGGKSGGQKEKLAYTVLAASLAYQFGLEWGEIRSRSFRFVAIDEAFGRGSDESTRYSLELFEKLNLQLLIVTPLQKIHIIEPFVAAVGFVHNNDGSVSQLRNMSVEEYRGERQVKAQ